jgi:dTMP kinase
VHADLQPDLTLLFDVAPEIAAKRLARTRAADRFEAEEVGFFQAVRREYLVRAERDPARFFVVDGTRPPDALSAQLTELMQRWSG